MSLEPALAALSGMVFLGETLKLSQTLALGAIIIASMGATLTMQESKSKESSRSISINICCYGAGPREIRAVQPNSIN